MYVCWSNVSHMPRNADAVALLQRVGRAENDHGCDVDVLLLNKWLEQRSYCPHVPAELVRRTAMFYPAEYRRPDSSGY